MPSSIDPCILPVVPGTEQALNTLVERMNESTPRVGSSAGF